MKGGVLGVPQWRGYCRRSIPLMRDTTEPQAEYCRGISSDRLNYFLRDLGMGDSWEYANEGVDVFLATFSGLQVPWCLSALAGPLLLSPWEQH